MKPFRNKPFTRTISLLLIPCLLVDPFTIQSALALTSGPSQPEFASFEPVSTTQMVNEFTGEFTYNLPVIEIPGPEGSGYSLSLSYHSGASPEEEASWVGYGWALNPGATNRNKRGLPDDYKGQNVKTYNDVPANWTASIGGHIGNLEAFSVDVPLSLNASIKYNNYSGFGYTAGIGFSVKGVASLGYAVGSDDEGHFTYSVNPAALLQKESSKGVKDETAQKDNNKTWKKKTSGLAKGMVKLVGKQQGGTQFGFFSQNWVSRPTKVHPYTGTALNITASLEGTPACVPVGLEAGIFGGITAQQNTPVVDRAAYGYMYAGNAIADPSSLQDYFLEHESPYQKRDKFLAIPFSNPDFYSVNGEGLGGGFRLHNKKAGHFSPNATLSTTTIVDANLPEFQAGTNVGAGVDVNGVGLQTLDVQKWEGFQNEYNFDSPGSDTDEPVFFRFKNDLGGNLLFGNSLTPEAARVSNKTPEVSSFSPELSTEPYNRTQQSGRVGRASYIGYHTNSEMDATVGSNLKKAYTKDVGALQFVSDKTGIEEGVGEFIMTNEDGFTYDFGLPVYARNEENIQYSLKNLTAVEDNYIAFGDINSGNIRSKVGEERKSPYATTYLLTSITSPDYIDRKMDGPTSDDFGGYTRFTYQQAYGTPNDKSTAGIWYKWRLPYNGFFYDRSSLSDIKDDQCAYMSGEKEVYYLKTIETRTHKAIFYTSERYDGIEAPDNASASNNSAAMGTNKLQKLDSIQLIALDPAGVLPSKLLQTVHFKYDYELMPQSPNTDAINNPTKAKLTLKRVWTDYEGTAPAKIAPYEFSYQYESSGYPSTYTSFDNYGNFSTTDENPDYKPANLDAWGSYQKDGSSRFSELKAWVNQTPANNFDPAAWQLKVIRLPSGGEIHVQYEQHTYQFVQNRRALAMVSLKTTEAEEGRCFLNVEDLGISPVTPYATDISLNKLKYLIEKELVEKDEKIYFKFLYQLLGSSTPNIASCSSEFITGYAKIKSVGIDATKGLYIELDGTSNFPTTRSVCRNFVKTSRGGMLSADDCQPSASGLDASLGPKDIAYQLIGFIGTTFSGTTLNCLEINPSLSYLRIPVLYPKKGGGVRVKRLLLYDKGLNGKTVLQGSEYIYEKLDPLTNEVISSGVASNEPDKIREENALVTSIEKRKDQGFFERIFSGKDRAEFEGVIGESLLPNASIGYSKVVVKNIHSGKTNPGFTVKEFNTTYDYPFDKFHPKLGMNGVSMTQINEGDKDWLVIPAGLSNYAKTNLWLTQGYSFIQTDFDGKPKRSATYAGPYYANVEDASALISSEKFNYFDVGEQIPISLGLDYSSQTVLKSPGKEMELFFESKKIEDIAEDASIEGDANACLATLIPIPFITAFGSVNYQESKLHTHVAVKITSFPAIVKSVERFQDGLNTLTENLAFSPDNCRPVLTRTTDGFHGLNLEQSSAHKGFYWNYDFSASDIYPALGQRAFNERRVLTASGFEKLLIGPYLKLLATTSAAVSEMEYLTPGDLVALHDNLGVYHIGNRIGNLITLHPFSQDLPNSTVGAVSKIEVLNSGKANRLNESAGNLVVYGGDLNTTLSPTDLIELNKRHDFANYLTTSLITGSNQIYHNPLDIFVSEGLSCPDCISCDSLQITFHGTSNIAGIDYTTLCIRCRYQNTSLAFNNCPSHCCFEVPRSTMPLQDHFDVDDTNGRFIYYLGTDLNTPILVDPCKACPELGTQQIVTGVIDVNISTYSDEWTLPADQYPIYKIDNPNASPYELGFKGKWRPDGSYVYREGIISGIDKPLSSTTNRIYKDAGTFAMTMFDWNNLSSNDPEKWLKVNQTNLYSPHGQALEEQDIRGVKSAAKYGYQYSLPYLLAQNASNSDIYFESFENIYQNPMIAGGQTWEEALAINLAQGTWQDEAHAGKHSLLLKINENPFTHDYESSFTHGKSIPLTSQVKDHGLLMKVWVKTRDKTDQSIKNAKLHLIGIAGPPQPFERIAKVGEWELYEARVPASTFTSTGIGAYYTPRIIFDFHWSQLTTYLSGTKVIPYEEVWLDDIRFQPGDAQMTCYVYDPTSYELLTSFDDQHFGLYYQYNAQGELVRKIVETERGKKTVQETQYHTPLKSRN